MQEVMDSVLVERNERFHAMTFQIDDRDPGRVVDASRGILFRFRLDFGRNYALDASAKRQAWLFQYNKENIQVVCPYFESKFTYNYTNNFGVSRETDCTNIFLVPRDIVVRSYEATYLRATSLAPRSGDTEQFLSDLEEALRTLNEPRVQFAEKTLGKAVPVKVIFQDIFSDRQTYTSDSSVINEIALRFLLDEEVGGL